MPNFGRDSGESGPSSSPDMASRQLAHLGIQALWEATRGRGVKVGVLDSGVNHSRALPPRRVQALVSDGEKQEPTASTHGTFCAAAIASELEGSEGIAPESRILSIQVTSGDERFSPLRVKRALRLAIDEGCDVISCSFTLARIDDELERLVREAHLAGIPVIAAGGNDPEAENDFPERVSHAIVVNALDTENNPLPGRQTIWTDVYCLGDRLDVVDGNGDPFEWPGFSSGATALVAGVVALALAPLTPARRRRAGILAEHLLKTTAARSARGELASGTLLRIAPEKLFRAIQEVS